MSDSTRKRTKYLTVSAILTALGVVLLALGSLLEVLDLSSAVLASVLCVYAVIELRGPYPWMIFAATALLALLLLPQKTPAIFYALFAGFYPILKEKLEKLPTLPSMLLKVLTFHISLGLIVLFFYLFLPAQLEETLALKWMLVATYALALGTFFVYDYAMSKLITLYLTRLRGRFRIK